MEALLRQHKVRCVKSKVFESKPNEFNLHLKFIPLQANMDKLQTLKKLNKERNDNEMSTVDIFKKQKKYYKLCGKIKS